MYQPLGPMPDKPASDSVRKRVFCMSSFLQVSAYMISSLSDLLRQVTGDHRLHTVLTAILHGLIVVPACESQHIQHPDHMVDLGLNARSLPFKERFLLGIGSCALCTPVHEIEKTGRCIRGFSVCGFPVSASSGRYKPLCCEMKTNPRVLASKSARDRV